MLVRPSVTPKDRSDYFAACPKRYDPEVNLSSDQTHSTVRFHPEICHISQKTDCYSEDRETGEEAKVDEEDFPIRKKPIKGRKQTGPPARSTATLEDVPSVSQTPKHQTGVSLDQENDCREVPVKPHKSMSMGVASKIAGAMRKASKKKAETSHDEIIGASSLTPEDQAESKESPSRGVVNTTYAAEAFTPVFAEGISLFSPKSNYTAKDTKELHESLKTVSTGKHAFARLVESARYHKSFGGGASQRKEVDVKRKEADFVEAIAPGPRARLLELARTAKIKAQQKPLVSEDVDRRHPQPLCDEDPCWNCAGVDHLLKESYPRSSVNLQQTTNNTLNDRDDGKGYRKAHDRAMKKSASRSRLVDQTRQDNSDDVVCTSRENQEAQEEYERSRHHSQSHHHRRERSRSRHGHHYEMDTCESRRHSPPAHEVDREIEEHRQIHRSRHGEHRVHQPGSHLPSSSSSSSRLPHPHSHNKSSEHVPDKRKGKVLDPGAETQRLNLALSMARTRMEMEIAEQQVQAHSKLNGNGSTLRVEKLVKDDEEKAWLEEAYEEAVKKELECQYLYEAHTLGGTW